MQLNENYSKAKDTLYNDLVVDGIEQQLNYFHHISNIPCKGTLLEELGVAAINYAFPDSQISHANGGHQAGVDYTIIHADDPFSVNISAKSGQFVKVYEGKPEERAYLSISGSRLQTSLQGGKKGGVPDFNLHGQSTIDYLNQKNASESIFSIFTHKKDTDKQFAKYKAVLVDPSILTLPSIENWNTNADPYCINEYGVKARIQRSLSWQLWWEIPWQLVQTDLLFDIKVPYSRFKFK